MRIPFVLLHTFVVTVNAKRMAAAADTLGVTPGAVSQRIKELEGLIGQQLFERTPEGIVLTPVGGTLFAKLNGAFSEIDKVYGDAIGRQRAQRFVISAAPSFAANWLVPRLTDFKKQHPSIEIALQSETRPVNLSTEAIDLAIRHGLGEYPGLECHWLMAPAQIVVASPRLLEDGPPIEKPEDCLAYPLLHDIEQRDWEMWLSALGIPATVPKHGQAFSDDNLIIRAAVAGQGLGLVYDTYAAEEIASGRLVQAYKGRWPTKFAYYLIGLPPTFRRGPARRFRDWLIAAARA
jgi:LysR family glycine cleavage system transcriptional activator